MQKVYYKVNGLNFNKFLTTLKQSGIQLYKLQRLEYNEFIIGVNSQDENLFIDTCKKLNYSYLLYDASKSVKVIKNFKKNIVLFFTILFMFVAVLISSNFVYKVEVYGLENITNKQIIEVLNNNGYKCGKLKSSYNINNIQNVLKENLKNISFASAIIKGNTLVVNIYEKIDNSTLIYEYKPIISPFDVIIKQINLKSGTAMFKKGDIVKEGQIIIMPYVIGNNGAKLDVEASATILAEIALCNTTIVNNKTDEEINKDMQNIIELNQKMLYNKLGDINAENIEFSTSITKVENTNYITTYLKADISF